jgi:hypothetical protein
VKSVMGMPMVTVEQCTRFRQTAHEIEQQRDELLAAVKRIYGASITKNNGAYMGEAVLCHYFEGMLESIIAEVEASN